MLTGIQSISTSQYNRLLRHKLNTGGNLLTFALAGSGKTEIPIAILDELNLPYQYINLSVLEAPDMIGVPRVDDVTGTMKYASPDFLPYIERTPIPVTLVVDELDKAKPELQNPMLELMQFHSVNGKKLNIRAIFCTGNMPDEGAFSLPVNHALTNRCSVYKMEINYPDWQAWAAGRVNELVVGFLSDRPDMLQVNPNKDDPTAYCRPSPRSWVSAARDLDALGPDASILEQTTIIAGRVGTQAAVDFRVWMEHYRVIAPHVRQLAATGLFPPPNMAIDKLLVCAITACGEITKAIAPRVVDPAKKGKAVDTAHVMRVAKHIFDWLETLAPDCQIAAVKSTLSANVMTAHKLTDIPSAANVFKNLRNILTNK